MTRMPRIFSPIRLRPNSPTDTFDDNYKVGKVAYKEAVKPNSLVKQQLACVILNKNKIVSKAYNFHSFGKTETCSCHAEMYAIHKHLKMMGITVWKNFQMMLKFSYRSVPVFHRLKGVRHRLHEIDRNSPTKLKNNVREKTQKYKLYVYRFLSDGSVCNAKPCAECSRWMYVASMMGIHYEIYYTDDDKKLKLFDYNSFHSYMPKNTYFF